MFARHTGDIVVENVIFLHNVVYNFVGVVVNN